MDLCFLKSLQGRATTKSLVASISDAIDRGLLARGERLPSTREVAQFTGTSRTTVVRAFDELIARGYLTGKRGQATYVALSQAPGAVISFQPPVEEKLPTFCGKLPVNLLPVRDWQKCMTLQYSRMLGVGHSSDSRPTDLYSLKLAICGFLRRTEGILCAPANVFVFTGTDSALAAVARMTAGSGVACEKRGSAAFDLFEKTGARVVELSIDSAGPRVDAMGTLSEDLRWLFLTPTGSRPSGITLSDARRYELLEWARMHSGTIIENVTGSEFQYSAKTNLSLFAQDRSGSVIYYRSLAGLLHPLATLEFLVVPDNLISKFQSFFTNQAITPLLEHMALAHFINDGCLEKHIRSAWKILRRRRQALIFALKQRFDSKAEIFASHAGTQIVVRFHDKWSRIEIIEAAQTAELALAENEIASGTSSHSIGFEFVIDFSALPEDKVESVVTKFAASLTHNYLEMPAVTTSNLAVQALSTIPVVAG